MFTSFSFIRSAGELMFSMSIHILDFLFSRRMDTLHPLRFELGDVAFERRFFLLLFHTSLALELEVGRGVSPWARALGNFMNGRALLGVAVILDGEVKL
jgi:hypothetical protein